MDTTPQPLSRTREIGLTLIVTLLGLLITVSLWVGITRGHPALPLAILVVGILTSGLLGVATLLILRHHNRLIHLLSRLRAVQERDRQTLQNKQIEKEVLSRALADSEQRTRDYIALGDGFAFELDEQGLIGFISPQIQHWYHQPASTLAREPLSSLLPEKEHPHLEQAMARCLRERTSEHLDTWLVTGDGQQIPISLRFCPVSDRLNQCLGFRGLGWPRQTG
ncbi:MAG: PAS domain-containing protein [Oleiphilaceae bacterium]|nr:PAS domain-containing protein [Oleiphilaceae bacterium]